VDEPALAHHQLVAADLKLTVPAIARAAVTSTSRLGTSFSFLGVTDHSESRPAGCARSPLGTFAECPHCGGPLRPEHAHFRCESCGWRDSCCD
jgi:hypothetical protein